MPGNLLQQRRCALVVVMVSVVGVSDTSGVEGSDASAVLGFATSALLPAMRLLAIFIDRTSFIDSTDLYSFIDSTDMFSFVVRSSSAPPSMATIVGVRGCATAHSLQEVHTGGSVIAGVSAGNLVTQVPTIIALKSEANCCAALCRLY
jgi:hypothetical protein